MYKNKKCILLTFTSAFLLLAVVGAQLIATVAALRDVGVSEGDWVEYDFIYSGNGTLPPPGEVMDWAKITVLEISGTNITWEEITVYVDQSNETKIYVLDVDTGQGNGTGVLVAKNLNQSDLIYTSPPPSGPFGISFQGATINETIFREYLGGPVEVNHWNLTMSTTVPAGTISNITNLYWFRATGMAAELSVYMLSQPNVGDTLWLKMEAVIIDIIPEFPPSLLLPLFMTATLTTVWVMKTVWSTKKPIKKIPSNQMLK